jgi:hypothetical protein
MMEIPFFKKYRRWKAFYFWKKMVNREKTLEWGHHLTVRRACCVAVHRSWR